MLFSFFDAIFSFFHSEMFVIGVLWTGLAVITVALLVLMRTRWGQARPIRKCLILSLIAHILLAGYAATIQIGGAYEQWREPMVAHVEIVTEPETPPIPEEPKATQPAPWDAFTQTREPTPVPEADESPRPESLSEPNRREAVRSEEPGLPPESVVDSPAPPAKTPAEEPPESIVRTAPAHPAASSSVRSRVDSPELPSPADPSAMETIAAVASPARPSVETTATRHVSPAPLDNAIAAREPAAALLSPSRQLTPAGAGEPIDRMRDDSRLAALQPSTATLVPVRPRIGSPKFRTGAGNEPPRPSASEVGPPRLPGGATVPEAESVPAVYRLRTSDSRLESARGRGATEETEKAVAAALTWLAANQERDGRWSPKRHGGGRETKVDGSDREMAGINADTGVTGLALLAFLGTGNTHQAGVYQKTVAGGLAYLVRSQAPNGNLRGEAGTYAGMYCHAMASLAVAEAYALTGDKQLEQPLRRALGYTLLAQDKQTGGWRYYPGDAGDTSQLGWQVLLLKSAEAAGIRLPHKTREGAIRFLRSVSSGTQGGLASYRPGMRPTLSMTAEALVCREFLGMPPASPTAVEAAAHLMNGLPNQGEMNLYYWYYATLGLHQLQDAHWQRWNAALQDVLLGTQRTEGPRAGSWDPVGKWGGYGGRVYSTAMGALCLEVYYRYEPLSAIEEDRVAGRRITNEHE